MCTRQFVACKIGMNYITEICCVCALAAGHSNRKHLFSHLIGKFSIKKRLMLCKGERKIASTPFRPGCAPPRKNIKTDK